MERKPIRNDNKKNDFKTFIEIIISIAERRPSTKLTKRLPNILEKYPEFINTQANLYSDMLAPLSIAIIHGADANLLEYLIQNGADVNQLSGILGRSALMHASKENRVEYVRFLLAHGADVNLQSKLGDTALMLAPLGEHARNRERVVQLLLNAGADIHLQTNKGGDALMRAVYSSPQIVHQLLSAGANVHQENVYKETALIIASRQSIYDCRKRDDIIQILLSAGSDVNHKTSDGSTPLMTISSRYDASPLIIQKMLDAGADPNMTDDKGRTALMYSTEAGTLDTVRQLVEHGAKIDIQDDYGRTALMYAVHNQRHELIEYLIEHGAETALLNKTGRNIRHYVANPRHRPENIQRTKRLINRYMPRNGGSVLHRYATKKQSKNKTPGNLVKRRKTRHS